MQNASKPLTRLLEIMAQLRHPETGCPWDIQQTFQSIVPHTLEEAYEVADAIEFGTMDDVKEELGDLLFQVVFYAQLGKEQNQFDFSDIVETLSDKLVRRHPHVFGDTQVDSPEAVKLNWERIKEKEKEDKGEIDTSVLANIPVGLTPLIRAHKLQKRCAKVGFDWGELSPVIDKINEEVGEVLAELEQPEVDKDNLTEEVGDLFFSVVNLARYLDVDADAALRKANHKFEQRFRKVEAALREQNKQPKEASLDEMESLWQAVKNK
ncbi:nucleoside triphosphate pyrophosphohydrolase [Alteromonas sp. a30]|uniref:nucleoside triphosphate pyrophosphohydrolase n=1 Tax=Alteromonas sp. a30 TaxID=2730917 RepID=UPI002280911F|nr:nucleoside triphosphate pyrophosphohydrolase [Alteromonas sp. a30]MCY7294291.1 nucleoside triphosphate pyrophosphohydrolase [Alteromonas sp. a30]